LRLAAAQPGAAPKIQQNLALVVAMQGRIPEAESIARYNLPPAEADASVTYLRNTLTQYKSKQGNRTSAAPARRKLSANTN
jgi:Flp pilus assembly protein TadD